MTWLYRGLSRFLTSQTFTIRLAALLNPVERIQPNLSNHTHLEDLEPSIASSTNIASLLTSLGSITRRALSLAVIASNDESCFQLMLKAALSQRSYVCTHSPLVTSHNLIVLSHDALARILFADGAK